MNLREALVSLNDPRYQNRRYPLWGVVALVLVAFLCRVDSLRGVARFAQANPFLYKPLGLRKAPGRTAIAQLIRRLDPQALSSALQQVFPELSLPASFPTPTSTLVADGKVLRGSAKGESPVVRVVELWCEEARHSLTQAQVNRREDEALLGLLERMGLESLAGRVVAADAGFLYPQVAEAIRAKGRITC
ncbi:transposase family protein [Meiothermus granaticius]|uniref:DDE Tnp 1-associated n=1 Tax=Meiothermus granaticius NBRC 107808 TaxID=1227551 RepID=A0A399FCG9_9DEIN|nr:transposase family protein [Meiothermus granaticius]MCL6527984.1 transposase family protein [Thermaceae bacterium]RIH92702.1 DDE Tnp 1-associated [Meiothermus granaticius NBRC 107808]GEM87755.1 hypothetical protein MGR01S_23800 [Meiothermus granaticius NBRC 107808]